MNQFLRAIRDLYPELAGDEDGDACEVVLRGYNLLQPTYAKLRMGYEQNIERLFATFEMIRILESEYSDAYMDFNVDELSKAMRRVIGLVIERRMLFPVESRSGKGPVRFPHRYLWEFVNLLREIAARTSGPSDIAILTFNYDVGLDFALSFMGAPFNYCLDPETGHAGIRLLKLHGSLNWSVCSECGSLLVYHLDEFVKSHPLKEERVTSLMISKHLGDLQHGDEGTGDEPFIVPPTWNKTEYQNLISQVWSVAAEELAEATKIIVCGYSFPPTDEFFRHLLALGLSGGEIIDLFYVIDPDNSAHTRFKNMLGEPIQDVLKTVAATFEGSLNRIGAEFDIENIVLEQSWD